MTATTAMMFGALALVLAGPVPALLARARWTYRVPRAALVLWQAVAVAAVLSAFGSGLAIATLLLVPGEDGRPTTAPLREIDVLGLPLWLAYVAVFALTLVIGARLMYAIVTVAIRTRTRRARHRDLVDLLDRPDDGAPVRHLPHVRVLDTRETVAYCLPGRRHRVVLSEGTLDNLGQDELRAVLRHEHSHLRARHDLVLEAFLAVYEAFPRIVRSGAALGSVQLLVELLADDSAVRATGPTPLARALVACAGAQAPQGAMAIGGTTTVLRVRRLADPAPHPAVAIATYAAAGLLLVVPTIAVAVPWLTELGRLLGGI